MKKQLTILMALFLCFQFSNAQEITTYQYRRVEQADMQEYLKRETTYWSKLAESEVKKGNLTFWGIFVKMDGTNMQKAPNVLIINSFKDIDTGNSIWAGVSDLFPDVKMEDIQTGTLSKTVANIYTRGLDNFISKDGANPDEDFNFIKFIFHNTKNNQKHLTFEREKWKPMLQKAMNEGKTTHKAWGNAVILSPESSKFQYNSISYDIFASVKDALLPAFDQEMLPDGFFEDLQDNYAGPRSSHLYRKVMVVSAPPSE